MSPISVAVLMGGPDAEREVSIRSGRAVAQALRTSPSFKVKEYVIDIPTLDDISKLQCDIVFPVLHGPYGEGGPLQELLEKSGKSFVGSTSKPARHAMDKISTKRTALDLGILTPDWCVVTPESPCTLAPPLVLKPNDDGSSVDVVICKTESEIQSTSTSLLEGRTQLLAEHYIQGRELTVGIVNGIALPIIEILPPADSQSYDYDAKYQSNDTQYIVSPNLPEHTCVESALQLYTAMNIRDIARVDFLLDEDGAWLLEINTMPGFTSHSLLPMAAGHAGMPMAELCAKLIFAAAAREVK